jgi:hypothetical protein
MNSQLLVGSFMLMLLLGTVLLQQVEQVRAACENIEVTLASCQSAVSGAHPPPPTKECCSTLKELSVGCLCKALSQDVLKNVNKQAAYMLPSECQVSIPPGFNCEGTCILLLLLTTVPRRPLIIRSLSRTPQPLLQFPSCLCCGFHSSMAKWKHKLCTL